jgi:hypothetical protein
VPILLLNRCSRGALYVPNIADNPGDLYRLLPPVINAIRAYLQAGLPGAYRRARTGEPVRL